METNTTPTLSHDSLAPVAADEERSALELLLLSTGFRVRVEFNRYGRWSCLVTDTLRGVSASCGGSTRRESVVNAHRLCMTPTARDLAVSR